MAPRERWFLGVISIVLPFDTAEYTGEPADTGKDWG